MKQRLWMSMTNSIYNHFFKKMGGAYFSQISQGHYNGNTNTGTYTWETFVYNWCTSSTMLLSLDRICIYSGYSNTIHPKCSIGVNHIPVLANACTVTRMRNKHMGVTLLILNEYIDNIQHIRWLVLRFLWFFALSHNTPSHSGTFTKRKSDYCIPKRCQGVI